MNLPDGLYIDKTKLHKLEGANEDVKNKEEWYIYEASNISCAA
jgi:hypothetical protein